MTLGGVVWAARGCRGVCFSYKKQTLGGGVCFQKEKQTPKGGVRGSLFFLQKNKLWGEGFVFPTKNKLWGRGLFSYEKTNSGGRGLFFLGKTNSKQTPRGDEQTRKMEVVLPTRRRAARNRFRGLKAKKKVNTY